MLPCQDAGAAKTNLKLKGSNCAARSMLFWELINSDQNELHVSSLTKACLMQSYVATKAPAMISTGEGMLVISNSVTANNACGGAMLDEKRDLCPTAF